MWCFQSISFDEGADKVETQDSRYLHCRTLPGLANCTPGLPAAQTGNHKLPESEIHYLLGKLKQFI